MFLRRFSKSTSMPSRTAIATICTAKASAKAAMAIKFTKRLVAYRQANCMYIMKSPCLPIKMPL